MATKTHRTAADHEAEGLPEQQAQATRQARNQLAALAETTSMLCSATESIQQINQQLTQRTALRHQQLAQRLREAGNPAELMAISSMMFSAGMQEAAQYWQDVAAAAFKAHGDMVEHTSSSNQSQAPAHTGDSAFQVWQNMFTAPLGSFSGSGANTIPH